MRVASGVNIVRWLNNAAFVRKFNREPIAIVLDWQYHKDGPLAKCARRSHTSPATRQLSLTAQSSCSHRMDAKEISHKVLSMDYNYVGIYNEQPEKDESATAGKSKGWQLFHYGSVEDFVP